MVGDNFDLLLVKVTSELQSFQEWIHANKLTINYDPQKSSCSVFKPKNKQYTKAVYMLEDGK